jgi:hypothetical protein
VAPKKSEVNGFTIEPSNGRTGESHGEGDSQMQFTRQSRRAPPRQLRDNPPLGRSVRLAILWSITGGTIDNVVFDGGTF